MTAFVAKLLFPFGIVVGVALWAKGYAHVGDGFSAGAVAGLGAVVQYGCRDRTIAHRTVGARHAWWLVSVGLMVVLAVFFAPLLFGFPPVTHFPPAEKKPLSLGVVEAHSALAFDAGVAMLVYGALVGTFDRLFPPIRGGEP